MAPLLRIAPLNTPLRRRRQTFAVLLWILFVPLSLLLFGVLLLQPTTAPLALAYLIFIFVDAAHETGGRPSRAFRRLALWRWLRDFFPAAVVKTTDLDPAGNYVFLYHPHGIISLGAFINFGTDAAGFAKLFPGVDVRLLTLEPNFRVPFFREILLFLGICSVSRQSCQNVLAKGPGHSIMIVPGGAKEALLAFPGTMDLVLRRRLGFVKLALRNGASLVPVVSFGETDMWDQVPNPEGSLLRSFQVTFQRYASFSPPLFFGRGIMQYDFGLLPYRRPIVSVVGKPIPCPRMPDPPDELVRSIHEEYMDALKALYDEHKDAYAPNRKSELRIVE